MKALIVDITKIDNPYCGLGQYGLHYATHLIKNYPETYFYLSRRASRNAPEEIKNHLLIENIFQKKWGLSFPQARIWHGIHQDVRVFPKSKKMKRVLTIHDLFFLNENTDALIQDRYLKNLQQKIDLADAVVFISEYTKQSCLEKLNFANQVTKVIYNGACLNHSEKKSRPLHLPKEVPSFFLSIGAITPKKNFDVLIDVAKSFPNEFFVLAGDDSHEYARLIKSKIKEYQIEDRFLLLGKVIGPEKNYLYSQMKALLHPSFLEGFGLPLIEAMSMSKPVLCSNTCSMPEITGNKAFYFDPYSTSSMIETIQTFLRKENEIDFLEFENWGNKFNWEKTTKEYIQLFNELA